MTGKDDLLGRRGVCGVWSVEWAILMTMCLPQVENPLRHHQIRRRRRKKTEDRSSELRASSSTSKRSAQIERAHRPSPQTQRQEGRERESTMASASSPSPSGSSLSLVKQWKCFGGYVKQYSHDSYATKTPMKFTIFLPPAAEQVTVPVRPLVLLPPRSPFA